MQHYQCGRYWVPTRCQVPTLSQDDETIITAAQLVQELKGSVPVTVEQKLQYVKQLQQLTAIIANKPLPRVEDIAYEGGHTNNVHRCHCTEGAPTTEAHPPANHPQQYSNGNTSRGVSHSCFRAERKCNKRLQRAIS